MYRSQLIGAILAVGNYTRFVLDVFLACTKQFPSWRLLREQLYEIGVASLAVVAITGLSTGMVLAAQTYFQLSDKGLASMTGLMVAKAMTVELGPVLTAFMVTGRVGAAMCAELGTMRVTEQIDAMRSMSVNPLSYLIAPRFLGSFFMMPLLTIFSVFMGIFGGYIITVYHYGQSAQVFLDSIPLHITNLDLFSCFFKAFIFGIIIVTISCYKGMMTTGGAAGVGRFTTNSVVICYSIILITNFFITLTLNGFYGYINALMRIF